MHLKIKMNPLWQWTMNSQAHKQTNDHQQAYHDSQKNTCCSISFHIASNLFYIFWVLWGHHSHFKTYLQKTREIILSEGRSVNLTCLTKEIVSSEFEPLFISRGAENVREEKQKEREEAAQGPYLLTHTWLWVWNTESASISSAELALNLKLILSNSVWNTMPK